MLFRSGKAYAPLAPWWMWVDVFAADWYVDEMKTVMFCEARGVSEERPKREGKRTQQMMSSTLLMP